MSLACLQLTEATIAYPGVEGEYDREEITLWGPETLHAMPGAAAWLRDPNCYPDVCKLMCESGLHWGHGPYRTAVQDIIAEMEEWEEHGTAYDKWCQEETNMEDLHESSLFTEWNQAEGHSTWVGAGEMKKNMKVHGYTPEMLQQRDELNWCFNFKWNNPPMPGCPRTRFEENITVPDQTELLTLVAVGENHGVAKSDFGAVFIPRGAIQYLQRNGGATIGTIFDGEMTFTPGNKFPWRLNRDGVKFTYEDLTGNRPEEDY